MLITNNNYILILTSLWQHFLSIISLYVKYRAPSQYPKRRLSVRSRKVSKPRDLYLELSYRFEIWQALRQQCCRCACQISKRYDNLKYQSRGFETLRDLTERRLFRYWDGAQMAFYYLLMLPRVDVTIYPLHNGKPFYQALNISMNCKYHHSVFVLNEVISFMFPIFTTRRPTEIYNATVT